jgi:hypothetical protein
VRTKLLAIGLTAAALLGSSLDALAQQGYEFGVRFRPLHFQPQNFRGFSYQGPTFRPMFGQAMQFRPVTFPPFSAPPIRLDRSKREPTSALGGGQITLRSRDGSDSVRVADAGKSHDIAKETELAQSRSSTTRTARLGSRTPFGVPAVSDTRVTSRPTKSAQQTAGSHSRSTVRLSADELSRQRR